MDPDEMKGMRDEHNSQENEEYSFLNETVKNPPIDFQKIFMKIIAIAGAAILFGVIAALAFYVVLSWRNSTSPNPVTIPSDEHPVQTVVGSITGNGAQNGEIGGSGENAVGASDTKGDKKNAGGTVPGGNSANGNDAGNGQLTGNGADPEANIPDSQEAGTEGNNAAGAAPATPTPTPTEEELDREALAAYARVQSKLRGIADEAMKSVVTVTGVTADDEWFDITNVGSNAASGLIVADNSVSYLVLTDIDVIESAEKIAVTLPDGSVVEASFQKKDPVTGLCVISIPRDKIARQARNSLSVATLGNSYNVNTGDTVLAVGAPMGAAGTFACGGVVSLTGSVEIVDGEYRLITTDMYGGKSGSGILINMDGEVVGIIEQEYASDDHHSITAIPISPLKSLIEKLSNNSALSYIGIHGLDISEKAAEAQDIPSGVYVSSVDEDSPALQAGLQPGDIITSVGLGSAVTLRSLHENIMNRSPGDNVEVTVMRQGSSKYAEFDFVITIGELPEVTESESATSEEREAEDASKSDESGETESSAA